jgi:hypothetical protein
MNRAVRHFLKNLSKNFLTENQTKNSMKAKTYERAMQTHFTKP